MGPRPQDYGLLVVSDLHLSEGRHDGTKRFSRNEDFFFDEEFARFLEYYQDEHRWNGKRWHLVIAGDFLDLLQVTSIEGASAELRRDRDHPEYGLACGEPETVFKLRKIANGHWQFFQALASFVATGNLLTILGGNHDVEFHYPGVRAAFLQELNDAFARLSAAPSPLAANINDVAVRFGDWFHYEKDLIWIEHGNRYDGANTFRTWLAPLLPEPRGPRAEVDLPLGSLFVRYLFNRIESVEPFADNIKPQTRFVRWLLAHHPVTALRFLLSDAPYMVRKLRRALAPKPAAAVQAREAEHQQRLAQLADESRIDRADLDRIDALRARSDLEETTGFLPRLLAALVRAWLILPLAYAVLAIAAAAASIAAGQALLVLVPPLGRAAASRESLGVVLAIAPWVLLGVVLVLAAAALRWALTPEEKPRPSNLLRPANEIASRLGVRYVVMGHTHDAELCALDRPGGEYFNTGTWTKVFSDEERLIRSDVEFVFVQGVRRAPDDLQVKLMEWNDGAREPRLLKLFEDGEPERDRRTYGAPRDLAPSARSAAARRSVGAP